MSEVIALVKMNGGKAMVMRDEIKMNYKRYGEKLIVGVDDTNTFVRSYFYANHMGSKAFGGREFELVMGDGEVVVCRGQWWDGEHDKAAELLRVKLVDVSANSVESLGNRYVYRGYMGIKSEVDELVEGYQGELFDYYEFENRYWDKVRVTEVRGDRTVTSMKKVKNPNFVNEVEGK